MDDNKLNVLIVEDDAQLLRILQAVLKQEVEMRIAGTGRLALQLIEEQHPSIVLLDMRLPDMPGMDILRELAKRPSPSTVIVMTAHGSVDLAVDAMREGAYDFLTKPLDFERVKIMVRNAVERHRIILELDSYKTQYERTRFRGLMGSSPAMQRLYRQLRTVGMGSSPALLLGEKGTELEACARALHDEGSRAAQPFATLPAGALTPQALRDALERAGTGSVLITDVESLPPDTQTPLLAALADGSLDGRAVRARVFASSHDAAALAERLAPELLTLLCVARIEVAPLRERGEDVLDLAEALLEVYGKELGRSFTALSDEVELALVSYGWPGNRAELENVVRSILQRHEGRVVIREMLPEALVAALPADGNKGGAPLRGLAAQGAIRPLWQVERDEIERAIKLCDGNVLHAARLLEISPGTIYRKQQSWKGRAR